MEDKHPDVNKQWENLEPQLYRILQKRRQRKKSFYLKIAASVLLFFAASFFWLDSEISVTAVGQPITITMADGSVVSLNENTTLSYPRYIFWRNSRQVELNGEAFFEVAKDQSRPFIINSPHHTTQVLGTSFNLNDHSYGSRSSLSVATGKVQFQHKNSMEKVVVNAGEKVNLLMADDVVLKVEKYDHDNDLAWRSGKFIFKSERMTEVLRAIQKYYKVKFNVEDQNILKLRFSGTFEDPELMEFLKVFSETMNVSHKVDNGVINLYLVK